MGMPFSNLYRLKVEGRVLTVKGNVKGSVICSRVLPLGQLNLGNLSYVVISGMLNSAKPLLI